MKPLFFLAIFLCTATSYGQDTNNEIIVSKPVFIPVEKNVYYQLGDRKIKLQVLQYGTINGTICINLHDNEGTSVKAAHAVMQETGGTLIRIENSKQRVIRFKYRGIAYAFDPNRMFSRAGIEQTMRDNRRFNKDALEEIEKFAQRVLALIPDTATCVIALHNNTEGAFSIKSYLPGNERQWDARAVYQNEEEDIDDIALTTDSLLYQQMADSGYNSIWQHNDRAKKDGSLSIYYGELGKRYINIETQHGKVDKYVEMLQKLLSILAMGQPPVAVAKNED